MCVPQAVGDTGEGQARRKCEGGDSKVEKGAAGSIVKRKTERGDGRGRRFY